MAILLDHVSGDIHQCNDPPYPPTSKVGMFSSKCTNSDNLIGKLGSWVSIYKQLSFEKFSASYVSWYWLASPINILKHILSFMDPDSCFLYVFEENIVL